MVIVTYRFHVKTYSFVHIFAETHNAEQPMKIVTLFVGIHSVPQGAVDLAGRGGTPFAALTALALQLGMAAHSDPLEVV